MSGSALILTYHAVEEGPPPLFIDPALFASHLDCLLDAGVQTLTVGEVAAAVRAERLPRRCVAITFDDGFESVATHAAPLLAERGQSATVFCVAGRLGRLNDWPTQPQGAPRARLAGAAALAGLAEAGFEIGSHGMEHFPLRAASGERLEQELVESKAELERAVEVAVESFAYPYGVKPGREGRRLLEAHYSAACAGGMRGVRTGTDVFELPRLDAHYVRRPALLRGAVDGRLGWYLRARNLGARARRFVRSDHSGA